MKYGIIYLEDVVQTKEVIMPSREGRRIHVRSFNHTGKLCKCWGRKGNITRLGVTLSDDIKSRIGKAQRLPIEQLLKRPNTANTRRSLRKRLLKDNLVEEVCQMCGLGPVWKGKPLTLQIDHIQGKKPIKTLADIRLLCPNCHSQTSTYAGRNR